jgi:uncharacterized LabA/DUF88 family protein
MTTTPHEGNARLAVLIDADNADSAIIDGLLAEVAKYGVASVKRIYGDWTSTRLSKWKETLLPHSIQPMQQFAYTSGKNATDSAMIIDAMDLLHTDTFDGFCLVSSDSDFTRLASRIRESGKRVIGFGERKTPEPFVKACDQFIYNDIFRTEPGGGGRTSTRMSASELKQNTRLVERIRAAVEAASGEDGAANLGAVGSIIVKQEPEFDPRNFGYARLSDLVEAIGLFTLDRQSGKNILVSNTKAPAKKSSRAPRKRSSAS